MLRARETIAVIPNLTEAYYCKLSYLLAGRANELCGIGSEDAHTSPVGPTKESVSYDSFEGTEAILIQVHIEKRRQLHGIPLRTVALPINEFEPWAKEIVKEVEKLGVNEPLIPIYRQKLSKIWARYGFNQMALALPENSGYNHVNNPLRHLRINDLISFYKLRLAEELPAYTGHKPSSIAKVSSALDRYLHLRWTDYFPKLLKALP